MSLKYFQKYHQQSYYSRKHYPNLVIFTDNIFKFFKQIVYSILSRFINAELYQR